MVNEKLTDRGSTMFTSVCSVLIYALIPPTTVITIYRIISLLVFPKHLRSSLNSDL